MFKRLVHGMSFQQTILRTCIKIHCYFFLAGSFQFLIEVGYKLGHPPIVLIIVLSIADEQVVFVTRNEGRHEWNILPWKLRNLPDKSQVRMREVFFSFLATAVTSRPSRR